MKKITLFFDLMICGLLAVGFFHETVREAVHYFLWAAYGVSGLGWLILEQEKIDGLFANKTQTQFLGNVFFDTVFMVAAIAHGWPLLAALQMFVIGLSVHTFFKTGD